MSDGSAASPIARQVEVVKRLFEAFARRDVEGALPLLDPGVRFLPITAHVAREGKAYEGHAGIREYVADVAALWDQVDLVPLEFEAVLGVVVVIGEVHARGPAGELRAPVVWTWKLRDGRVVEGCVHAISRPRARHSARPRRSPLLAERVHRRARRSNMNKAPAPDRGR
jgi:ketosteroid isomerase-like protein